MPRSQGLKKEKSGFSIDRDLNKKLEDFCEERSINKSKLICKLIKEFLEKTLEEEISCQDR